MNDGKRPGRVLVVEDSPTQAQQLTLILKSAGFEVETAYDGQAGFERFRAGEFDIVLSDVVMPGMDGYELCRKIKADAKGRNCPVVLLTALNELKDLIEGMRNGADNFLTKPYEPSFLLARIGNILSNKQAEKDEPTQSVCDPESGVCFMDKSFLKTLDQKRILDFLVSTFDDFLRSRQREAETKFVEARQRLELIEQREALVKKLADELKNPLQQAEKTLGELLGGAHGRLGERQARAVFELRQSVRESVEMLKELLESQKEQRSVQKTF
ncbi:MAG TPA: response regulator [Candidatus Obscuribacterales bacterium]